MASTSTFNPIDFYGKQMYVAAQAETPSDAKDQQKQRISYERSRMDKALVYIFQDEWMADNQLNKINRLTLSLFLFMDYIGTSVGVVPSGLWAWVSYATWNRTGYIEQWHFAEPFNFWASKKDAAHPTHIFCSLIHLYHWHTHKSDEWGRNPIEMMEMMRSIYTHTRKTLQ